MAAVAESATHTPCSLARVVERARGGFAEDAADAAAAMRALVSVLGPDDVAVDVFGGVAHALRVIAAQHGRAWCAGAAAPLDAVRAVARHVCLLGPSSLSSTGEAALGDSLRHALQFVAFVALRNDAVAAYVERDAALTRVLLTLLVGVGACSSAAACVLAACMSTTQAKEPCGELVAGTVQCVLDALGKPDRHPDVAASALRLTKCLVGRCPLFGRAAVAAGLLPCLKHLMEAGQAAEAVCAASTAAALLVDHPDAEALHTSVFALLGRCEGSAHAASALKALRCFVLRQPLVQEQLRRLGVFAQLRQVLLRASAANDGHTVEEALNLVLALCRGNAVNQAAAMGAEAALGAALPLLLASEGGAAAHRPVALFIQQVRGWGEAGQQWVAEAGLGVAAPLLGLSTVAALLAACTHRPCALGLLEACTHRAHALGLRAPAPQQPRETRHQEEDGALAVADAAQAVVRVLAAAGTDWELLARAAAAADALLASPAAAAHALPTAHLLAERVAAWSVGMLLGVDVHGGPAAAAPWLEEASGTGECCAFAGSCRDGAGVPAAHAALRVITCLGNIVTAHAAAAQAVAGRACALSALLAMVGCPSSLPLLVSAACTAACTTLQALVDGKHRAAAAAALTDLGAARHVLAAVSGPAPRADAVSRALRLAATVVSCPEGGAMKQQLVQGGIVPLLAKWTVPSAATAAAALLAGLLASSDGEQGAARVAVVQEHAMHLGVFRWVQAGCDDALHLEKGLASLAMLARNDGQVRRQLRDAGALAGLVALLPLGGAPQNVFKACILLRSLVAGDAAAKASLTRLPEFAPKLQQLLGWDCPAVQGSACVLLDELAKGPGCEDGKEWLASSGLLPGVLALLRSGDAFCQGSAVDACRSAVVGHPGMVAVARLHLEPVVQGLTAALSQVSDNGLAPRQLLGGLELLTALAQVEGLPSAASSSELRLALVRLCALRAQDGVLAPLCASAFALRTLLFPGCGMELLVDQVSARKVPPHAAAQTCPLCLSELQLAAAWRQLPCQHVLHGTCLGRLLTSGSVTCPLCRRNALQPFRDSLLKRRGAVPALNKLA